MYRVSTTPGNPGNLLELKTPHGNPGNLEFNGPPGNFCLRCSTALVIKLGTRSLRQYWVNEIH